MNEEQLNKAENQTESQTSSPQPLEKDVKEGYKSPAELVAKFEFDKEMKGVKDRIGDTNFIMGVIIIVLAVGFMTLLVAVATLVIQSFGFNSNVQSELIKAMSSQTSTVNQLNDTVNKLNSSIKQSVSTVPATINPANK